MDDNTALAPRQEQPAERKKRLAKERQQRRRQKLAQKGLTTRGTKPAATTHKPVHGCVICGRPARSRAYCSIACRV